MADLLERIGVTTDRVRHGEHALMDSARQPFTDAELRLIDEELDRIYADFVGKVAAGRRMPRARVETIARGRVWTGADALRLGLVDELGGMRRALRIAQERGGLPESARLLPALRVPTLRRLGQPRNSDDPRFSAPVGMPLLDAAVTASGIRERVTARTDLRLRQ